MGAYQYLKSAKNAAYDYFLGGDSGASAAPQSHAHAPEEFEPQAASPDATPVLDQVADAGTGPEFGDGGGFTWKADGDGGYVCVGAPPGQAKAVGFVVTREKAPDSYALLASLDPSPAAQPAADPATAAGPDLQASAASPSEGAGALDLLPGWEDLAGSVMDGARQAADAFWQVADGAVEAVGSPVASFKSWWASDLGDQAGSGAGASPAVAPGQVDPAAPASSAPATASDKAAKQAKAHEEGKSSPLDAAIDLADDLDMQHGYDGAVDGDLAGSSRRRAILDGKVDTLKTILCSEFTAAVVQKAGYDLTDHFLDPATGHYIAYADGQRSDGSPKLTVVDTYMIVNTQPEATRAVLEAAAGTGEVIDPASARAAEVGGENLPGTFIYTTQTSFVGMEASAGHEFGAGAAAVNLGGEEIDPADRKPGDLNQTLNTKDGKYVGSGHSSLIHSVKGIGVARLGDPGSPEIEGASDLPAGWYEIPAGSTLRWVLGPETDPATVASLTADHVQLIDANERGVGNDATEVGGWSKQRDYSEKGWSKVTSSGRLPTSPWFTWMSSSPGESVEVLQ